jgi:hypothetical protein
MATARLPEVEAVEPSVSVAVAVTVRLAVPAKLPAGAVRVRFDSCTGVSVQLPSEFFVPADRLATLGTPVTLSDRLSVPSVAVSAELIDNAIADPALPDAFCTVSVGAVATPAIATARLPEVDAVEPSVSVSVAVAVALRFDVPAKLPTGATRLKPDSCAGVSVQLPSEFFVPADRFATLGTPVTLIDRLSVPSVAVSAELIDNAIADPALPDAF